MPVYKSSLRFCRFASQYGGYSSAVQIGRQYTKQARAELDIDEPSIETLQTLLLLSQAMYQEGRGKKSYMYLCEMLMVYVYIHRLMFASICNKYGLRIEPTPRASGIVTSRACRTRRPQAAFLGLLLTRPLRSMRLETTLTDSGWLRGPSPPLQHPPKRLRSWGRRILPSSGKSAIHGYRQTGPRKH